MLEIFRMQLRHMLGGKRKWLVAVCLLLPVLLTFAAASSGGLGHVRRDLERERRELAAAFAWARGETPPSAHRVTWQGRQLTFANGSIVLGREGLRVWGRPVEPRRVYIVGEGELVVRDGELWADAAVERTDRPWHVRRVGRGEQKAAANADGPPTFTTFCTIFLFLLYPQAVCLLLALFYGTSVLADELDGKTLTYLWVRPLPRWRFVVGKYLAIVAGLTVPSAAALCASWMIVGSPGGSRVLTGLLVATVGSLLVYGALFVLIGFLVPRRAMIAGLIYAIVFEAVLSFVPALVNELTVTYHLRSLVARAFDIEMPRQVARVVGGASAPVATFALAAIAAGSLALASWLAARREYVVKDAA